MDVFFQELFPPGFWKTVATVGAVLFFVIALDLLVGGRGLAAIGRSMNRKVHVDHVVVNALSELKKRSDVEVDTESSLTRGAGRFMISGLLFVCATLMLVLLIPKLH